VIVDVVGIVAAGVFAALSGLHVYWAVGGTSGSVAVIPTVEGRATLSPSAFATWVVAFLLALSALLLVGGVAGWEPTWLFRVGCAGLGLVMLARAVGDFRTVGFFKRVRDTAFARNDTRFFAPLCLGLGIAAGLVAIAG
jgi:Protein of unknown function (DUF3995)